MSTLPDSAAPRKTPGPQLVQPARDRVYAKRVPSSLTPRQQREAIDSVRAGRSFHAVAYELSCAEIVIAELYMRDVERRALRLAA